MSFVLVVNSPFDGYAVGDIIEGSAEVRRILESQSEGNVTKVAAGKRAEAHQDPRYKPTDAELKRAADAQALSGNRTYADVNATDPAKVTSESDVTAVVGSTGAAATAQSIPGASIAPGPTARTKK
jgi:hypothetical protein